MFGIRKFKELDRLLDSLAMNSANNYKDAARDDYAKLCEISEELKNSGKLKGKSADYYDREIGKWSSSMKNYNHQNNVKSF